MDRCKRALEPLYNYWCGWFVDRTLSPRNVSKFFEHVSKGASLMIANVRGPTERATALGHGIGTSDLKANFSLL
jgi:hypothetical protein